ncbi:MAG: DUF4349 domain-containing protein [Saccharofermentanales bacterium]
MNHRNMRLFLALLLIAVLAFTFFGCSKVADISSNTQNGVNEDKGSDTNGYGNSKADGSDENAPLNGTQRKIVFTASLRIETLSYDDSISDFEKLVIDSLGYVQESRVETSTGINGSQSLRTATYTVRIPSDKLGQFRTAMGDIGTITLNTITGDDVTDQYFDAQARLSSLRVQETRLLELLKEAASLADIMDIEDRLSEVRFEIESLTGSLAQLDSLVAMSTVTVEIYEVEALTEPKPESFLGQVSSVFKNSVAALVETLKALALILVAVLPFVLVFGALLVIILVFITKSTKRSNDRRAAKIAAQNNERISK